MTRRSFLSRLALGALAGSPCSFLGCVRMPEAPLRVGATVWPGYEGLFLARKLGLLDSAPIKLVEYTTTPEAIRAFRNGALEIVAMTGDEFLRLAADEADLQAVLVTDFSNGADALIARREFSSLKSLAGKRVGVEVNTTGVFLLMRALDFAGMNSSDIQITPLDNDQHELAFEKGEVDAVVTFEPIRTKILRDGGSTLFDSSKIPGEVADLLVTRRTTLERRIDRIRTLTAAWFKGREFMLNKMNEASAILAPREGVSADEFSHALRLLNIPGHETNRRLLTNPDGELMSGLRKIHRLMTRNQSFRAAEPSLKLLTDQALS